MIKYYAKYYAKYAKYYAKLSFLNKKNSGEKTTVKQQ